MADHELSRLLLSLVLLLSFSLGIGHIFSAFRLPRVIGEICAGILLGPSLLGAVSPEVYTWIFNGFAEQDKLLSVFYWLGLILLMFTAGFKISTSFNKDDKWLLCLLILGGLGLPFLFGWIAAPMLPNKASANPLAFALVIAVASAVTSIPVITRIFIDLEMITSRFAKVVLSAAAIQDIGLWIVLSIALSIQQGQPENQVGVAELTPIFLGTIVYGVTAVFIAPVILRLAARVVISKSPDASLLGYTLLVCMVLVSIASVLHVNIIFGALLAGVVIGRLPGRKLDLARQNISSVSIWFFVPVYFSLVGLQMDLPRNFSPSIIFGFLVFSSLVKVLSVVIFLKFAKVSWMRALDFGVTMNARGGPGIVLATVAYAAKIIDENIFVVLVLVSIMTSLLAGIWLRVRRPSILN